MDNRFRENFYLIWIAAVVFCAVAALFSVLFVSCSRGGGSTETGQTTNAAAVAAINTDSTAPEAVIVPAEDSAVPETEAPTENAAESEDIIPQEEAVPESTTPTEDSAPETDSDLAGLFEIAPAVNP